jgi:hypothetical protein
VIAEPVVEPHRPLAQRQQAFLESADGNIRLGMSVDDALDIRAAHIDCAVDHVSGPVGFVFGRLDEIAVEIHFQEVRRGDLVEHQRHRVDQEMVRLARHAGGIVHQYQIVPAEMRNQPIARGEIDPHRPFFRSDIAGSGGRPRFEGVHLLFSVGRQFRRA